MVSKDENFSIRLFILTCLFLIVAAFSIQLSLVILAITLFIFIFKNHKKIKSIISAKNNVQPGSKDEASERKLVFTYGDNARSKYCEFLVERYLSTLDKNLYTVINNVMLPSCGGNTSNTQIDHVVVSRFGIFCIETKSHRGWIYCGENEKSWLQILPRSCNEFYNPLRQNYAHVCAINALLDTNLRNTIISIAVFPSADTIIKKGVVNAGNIGYLLREIDKYRICAYNQSEYEEIVKLIQRANKNDEETVYRHKLEVSSLAVSLGA